MFTVNGMPILADEVDVVNKLKFDVLQEYGKEIFRTIRISGDNIMTPCPFHKDGQERRPSFGISTSNMGCNCFACGWKGTVTTMISELFNIVDGGEFGEKWLKRNFLSVSVESRERVSINFDRRQTIEEEEKEEGFTEEELDRYRYTHPYMYERGMTDEIIEDFDIGYDGNTACLTFPVYDVHSNPLFIARRSVRTKYFNYPESVTKPVYGANRVVATGAKSVIVCESIFNALTCWKHGKPAVALLGTGDEDQYEILRNLPVRKYVLAMDPDSAGRKATDRLKKALGKHKLISYLQLPEGKDVNDCDDIFHTLQEHS